MKKKIFLSLIIILIMIVSSCGQAGFDVTLNVEDTSATIAALATTIIQVEIPVNSSNLGINLEKIIYNYTLASNQNIEIEVKLSLYGDSSNDDIKIRTLPNGTGYPEYLTAGYIDSITKVSDGNKGWVNLIAADTPIIAGNSNTATTEILNNPVINQILKQDTIWIVVDIDQGIAIGTLEISNQSIHAVGSKATGYYPGVF